MKSVLYKNKVSKRQIQNKWKLRLDRVWFQKNLRYYLSYFL